MITAEIDTGFARIRMETDTIGIVRVTIKRDDSEMTFVLTSPEAEFIANSLRTFARGIP